MRSYCTCVPMNFTQTIPAWYCTSTTSLYLLPPTLNTTTWSTYLAAARQTQDSQRERLPFLADNPFWGKETAVARHQGPSYELHARKERSVSCRAIRSTFLVQEAI